MSEEPQTEVVEQITQPEKAVDHAPVIDLEHLYNQTAKTPEQSAKELEMFNKMKKLEFAIDYANTHKIEWLEVDQDILEYFYKGPVPEVGYYIYKQVKLCLKGMAESLAKRDNLTCHEILFPKESYMKLGVKRGGK